MRYLLLAVLFAARIAAQDGHHGDVNMRGDHVMGFSHDKTTHHFELRKTGGEISVSANAEGDKESRDQIRAHLPHIAKMFAAGDFNAPMLIHGVDPPGAAVMTRLKDEIRYTYEETERGGAVKIVSANPEAVEAIHQFLRFQIQDHKTGDSTEVR